MEAWKRVKANKGAAGVEKKSIAEFEKNLKNNLYKIWNRMSSGSYLPPPVRAVEIPKKTGGRRVLGVPSVADRVAQMVAKMLFRADGGATFSRGLLRLPAGKISPRCGGGHTRRRCWKYDWVLEFDIKGLFDNIDHESSDESG